MGVKDLWNVLAPIAQKTTLFELQNKKIAIDLSTWICESQIVGEKSHLQPRMYLRNVLFRTSILLMLNVMPIFIIDGEAPELKQDALAKRKQIRFPTAAEKEVTGCTRKRNRLKSLSNQCCNLLKLMGVECLESKGEGEALCAQLNRDGMVDGVITQDSDVFLYGAKTAYRNFTIHGGTGSVEVYRMDEIENKLNLTREKLVALSLLCGCDYNASGVQGVGKETAFKYLESLNGANALDRLRAWRHDRELDRYEEERASCTRCSHPGKHREHGKQGCDFCHTRKGCTEDTATCSFKNLSEEARKRISFELNLRRKALSDPNFPDEGTISEYLTFCQSVRTSHLRWTQPQVMKLIKFACKMLEWEEYYCFQKILPLSTRWQLLNDDHNEFVPKQILKKRVVKGTPSFEMSWTTIDENIRNLILEIEKKIECDFIINGLVVTVEPQDLILQKCESLYRDYMTELDNKKPKKAKKKKSTDGSPKVKKGKEPSLKTKKQEKMEAQCEKIDKYFQVKEKHEERKQEQTAELVDNFTDRIKKMIQRSKVDEIVDSIVNLSLNEADLIRDDICQPPAEESSWRSSQNNESIVSEVLSQDLAQLDESVSNATNSVLDDYSEIVQDSENVSFLNDSATQDYDLTSDFDISLIVDTIVSRKKFY